MARAVPAAGGPLVSRLQVCDGSQAAYQINIGAGQPYQAFVTDLASAGASSDLSGSVPASYKATRQQLNLVVAPQDAGIHADGVVNAATFTEGIAPGGLMSIFGTGLAWAGPGDDCRYRRDGGGGAGSVSVPGERRSAAGHPAGRTHGACPLGLWGRPAAGGGLRGRTARFS